MASILCRKGETFPASHRHDSVAQVRACQGFSELPTTDGTRLTYADEREIYWPGSAKMNRDALVRQPAADLRQLRNDTPAGWYAVDGSSTDNVTNFFRVDKPTEGDWAGYTFIKQISGAVPQGWRLSPVQQLAALQAIHRLGVTASKQRYGREIKDCGECGRKLTDDVSRARGIGPVCANKLGL